MLISENILRANVDSLVISSAYKGISKSIEAIASGSTTDKGMAALAIRELLRGEIAANQQAVRNATLMMQFLWYRRLMLLLPPSV